MSRAEELRKKQEKIALMLPFAELQSAALDLYALAGEIEKYAGLVASNIEAGESMDAYLLKNLTMLKKTLLTDQGKAQMAFNAALDTVCRTALYDASPAEPPKEAEPVPEPTPQELLRPYNLLDALATPPLFQPLEICPMSACGEKLVRTKANHQRCPKCGWRSA